MVSRELCFFFFFFFFFSFFPFSLLFFPLPPPIILMIVFAVDLISFVVPWNISLSPTFVLSCSCTCLAGVDPGGGGSFGEPPTFIKGRWGGGGEVACVCVNMPHFST